MRTTIIKLGNNYVLNIPLKFMEHYGLKEGDVVDISDLVKIKEKEVSGRWQH